MVLHTWNQKLDAHWHVHALVPGAGPAVDRDGVRLAVSPRTGFAGNHLVDSFNLRCAYRKVFLRGLKSLYRRGKLAFGGELAYLREQPAWDKLMDKLEQQEWVSHIEPPPKELSEADHVVSYMTRYLTGGPISDHRILAANDYEVTFLARQGNRTGGSREQVPMTLSTEEFVRRWCLHIQPQQLTKSRCFGGWNNSKRKRYQAVMAACIEVDESMQESDMQSTDSSVDSATQGDRGKLCCESCGSESLTLSALSPKPSWSNVLGLDSQCSPWWWGESQERHEKQQWDEAMGAGFYDWYVAEVLRPH